MGTKLKNVLKTALKFAVSGAALWFVFQNIDWDQTKQILSSTNWWWLSLATIFFTASKVLSSFRLNLYFRNVGLQLAEKVNLRLYWIGMFYNLFLPGGIGGDGYKVYLLNKTYKVGAKPLIQATLLDRISGLIALVLLGGVGYLFVDQQRLPSFLLVIDWIGLVLTLPLFYWIIKRFFNPFLPSFTTTTMYAFGVQLLQVICAYFILRALGVDSLFLEYQVLFLVSSVVAVFPFTIGGVGARELTFILGYDYLGIDQNVAVAFSLIFFLITAMVSLIGGFMKANLKAIVDPAQS